ncbi:MAG: ABC transporter ATP-binding protein [Planctomycetota bacterium]
MIEAIRLTKRYTPGSPPAVDEVSFVLEPGTVTGFLGPNGAGKSTTIRMLTGYLPPTSGGAKIDGHDTLTDAHAARRLLGYLPESNALYPEMRSVEFLHFVGKLQGMPRRDRKRRIEELTERCGLSLILRRTVARLSKGNRQRVGIASALMHDPPVVVLDEPTSGLDPRQMSEVRDLIRDLGGTHTVLLSTHLLPEVQRCCDRAIIIAGGRVVSDGSLDALRDEALRTGQAGTVLIEAKGSVEAVRTALAGVSGVDQFDATAADETGWVDAWLVSDRGVDVRDAAASALQAAGLLVREIRREVPTLEEYFFRVTDPAHTPSRELAEVPGRVEATGGDA